MIIMANVSYQINIYHISLYISVMVYVLKHACVRYISWNQFILMLKTHIPEMVLFGFFHIVSISSKICIYNDSKSSSYYKRDPFSL